MIAGARRVLGLAGISALARIPGFLIPVLVGAAFGAGLYTDAYFLAYGAVLLVGGTLGQSIEGAIVPFAAREFAGAGGSAFAFFGRTGSRVTLVAGLVWLGVAPLVVLAAPAALRGDVARYVACFTPLLLLWGAASVYAGALVAHGDIAAATGSLLWRGAGGLAGLGLAPVGGGLAGVALGLGAGELCRLWWLRRRAGAKASWAGAAPAAAALGSFPHAAAALAFAGVAMAAVPVVEKLIATSLGPGSVSHLEYATRLLIIPAVLFDGALAPTLLARWSRAVAAEGRALSGSDVFRPLGKGLVLAAVCAGAMAALAPVVVSVLLEHGRFTADDAEVVARLLRVLCLGFVANMGAILVERAFLAAARNRVLAGLSLLRAALRVVTALSLLSSYGILAFGVGYAVAEWCYFAVLVLLVGRAARVAQAAP